MAFDLDVGASTGVVQAGDPTPLPPMTDPTKGYPPSSGGAPLEQPLYEGFPYTIQQVDWTCSTGRLKFAINYLELWTDWCAAQTPYPMNGGDSYHCGPNCGYETGATCALACDGSPKKQVDCGWLGMCVAHLDSVCSCEAQGCFAGTRTVTFDLQITAGEAEGTFLAGNGASYSIHLSRK